MTSTGDDHQAAIEAAKQQIPSVEQLLKQWPRQSPACPPPPTAKPTCTKPADSTTPDSSSTPAPATCPSPS
ncbi:hypothetical protein ACFQ2B_40145 [Streptomyces stramineus]